MPISMYQASVPQLKKMLLNLTAILKKAEEYADSNKIDPTALLGARLFPNMFNFIKQVQIACDQAKNGCSRLAGIEPIKFADDEASFSDLQHRITKTIQLLDTLRADQIDNSEDREINFSIREYQFNFKGQQFLLSWIIPNFYFHLTTAYDLLRHNGLDVGKSDYLGPK